MICWQELFWWKNTTTFPFWNVNQWLILVKKKKTDEKKFGLEVYCMVGGISWASSSLWPHRIYLQFLDEISTETDGVKWMKTPSPSSFFLSNNTTIKTEDSFYQLEYIRLFLLSIDYYPNTPPYQHCKVLCTSPHPKTQPNPIWWIWYRLPIPVSYSSPS